MDLLVKLESFFFSLERGGLSIQCAADWKLAEQDLRQPRKRCPIAS